MESSIRVAAFQLRQSTAFLLLALGVIAACTGCKPKQPPNEAGRQNLMVRGYIAAHVGGHDDVGIPSRTLPARDVYIPGASVFLADAQDQPVGDSRRTDLSGRFTLYADKPGSYKICWKAAGFVSGCGAKAVVLGGAPAFLSTIHIPVETKQNHVSVIGQVTMADGTAARALEPLSNVNAFATVTLRDTGGGKLYETWVNNAGYYLIPQVPIRTAVVIRAQIERGVAEQEISPQAELERDRLVQINLRVANTPPMLEPVVPIDQASNRRIAVANPGAVVTLNAVARDRDGDPLHYTWELQPGSGALTPAAGPNVSWTLPSAPGEYGVTAIVWDGKGGYAKMPLLLRADGGGVPFSGFVRDVGGASIAQAAVEINGQTVNSDATGAFNTRVPDAARFVFNIRKQGYGFYSKIYDRGVTGGLWTLSRATVQSVDPRQPINLVDRRDARNCPGPRFARLDWKTYAHALQPQYQDGKGNVVYPAPRKSREPSTRVEDRMAAFMPWEFRHGECGPGMAVSIPANSLVDRNGNPPAGNVDVSIATVDLASSEQMPGDDTVVLPGGDIRVMQSFGAGMVEITAGGQRYNLKAGATAKIRLPVDPMQLSASGPIPPTIPILFYNETQGVWKTDVTAQLVGTGASRAYEAQVAHFSAINTDTLKVDQACVRVLSPQPGMPPTFNLEVTVPQPNGNALKFKTQLIDNSAPSQHVIYNLPTNTNITLIPSSVTPNTTPIGVFVVNTGQKQNPTVPNLPVGPPYVACSTEVILAQQVLPDAPLFGEFLHGLFSFDATNLDELNAGDPNQNAIKTAVDQATADYYAQIDPRAKRATLTDFRKTNGFIDNAGNPLAGVVNAKYANSGDLGFGRDMYCKKQAASDGQTDYACYVSNYGDVTTADQQDAIDAAAGGTPIATVAMEYSRVESPNGTANEFDDVTAPIRTVKFYVYNGAGNPLRAANLDGKGARPVPQLCMVCHGGALPHAPTVVNGTPVPVFNARDDAKLQSRFVPFDLRYYTFPPAPNDKANPNVQAAFKQMNVDIVKGVAQAVGATQISEVVDEMYAGGAATQKEDFVVAGWKAPAAPEPAKADFYQKTVSNACRMCHTAQPSAALRFDTASGFLALLGPVGSRVCNEHVMPHAKRTHDIFWGISDPTVVVPGTVPHMAAQLQAFGVQFGAAADWNGVGGNPPTYLCGTSFTSGGTTPLSYYEQNIQSIWAKNHGASNACTNCHAGQTGSGGLGLGAGFSYANLVGVNAQELNTMQRIKPLDSNQSYLFHKIQGTAGNVGGSNPSRMPLGCTPGTTCLDAFPADVQTIQQWIDVRGADGP